MKLIDADKLKDLYFTLDENKKISIHALFDDIDDLPTLVPVIYCKDCCSWDLDTVREAQAGPYQCEGGTMYVEVYKEANCSCFCQNTAEDFYCAYGKRRNEAE